ncbi:MAG: hypothetical protein IJ568_01255 [Bacilli bacterium]|nr:hypothetical protein [Bacilli bacterium]
MKTIKDEIVKVQKRDLKYLLNSCEVSEIPVEVIETIAKIASEKNDNKPKDYVEFNGKEAVNFFKRLDYIIDNEEVKNMSWTDSVNYCSRIIFEMNNYANTHDLTIEKYKEKYELLKYKLRCAKEIVDSKKGIFKISGEEKKEKSSKSLIKKIKHKK